MGDTIHSITAPIGRPWVQMDPRKGRVFKKLKVLCTFKPAQVLWYLKSTYGRLMLPKLEWQLSQKKKKKKLPEKDLTATCLFLASKVILESQRHHTEIFLVKPLESKYP